MKLLLALTMFFPLSSFAAPAKPAPLVQARSTFPQKSNDVIAEAKNDLPSSKVREFATDADASRDTKGTGITAVAYSSATLWKATECESAKPGTSLAYKCGLDAVIMVETEYTAKTKDTLLLRPTSLKCPAKRGTGVFDYLAKNIHGATYRVRTAWKDGHVVYLNAEVLPRGYTSFIKMVKGSPAELKETAEKRMLDHFTRLTTILSEQVCFGPKPVRDAYMARLAANMKFLKTQTRPSNSDDDQDVSEPSTPLERK